MYFIGPNKNVHVLILQLHEETEDGTLLEKIAVYQRANKEVNKERKKRKRGGDWEREGK